MTPFENLIKYILCELDIVKADKFRNKEAQKDKTNTAQMKKNLRKEMIRVNAREELLRELLEVVKR